MLIRNKLPLLVRSANIFIVIPIYGLGCDKCLLKSPLQETKHELFPIGHTWLEALYQCERSSDTESAARYDLRPSFHNTDPHTAIGTLVCAEPLPG
ncbi:MAG: hypothetical protein D6690_05235 [Nitrospirae bacterium]|nr:MAG: hypothetical protein D6690_05235 [Nitrospirota bacterium]